MGDDLRELAKEVVVKAATVMSQSTLHQILLKEAVKTALIKIRDIDQTTRKVIQLTEATIGKIGVENDSKVREFFERAVLLMADYLRRQEAFDQALKDIAEVSMEELPRFDIDFYDKDAFCRLEHLVSSNESLKQPSKIDANMAEDDFDMKRESEARNREVKHISDK